MIEIIKAKVGLENVYLKTKLSLEEIQEKHPERTDLIKSMEQAIIDLSQAKYVLHRIDLKNMSLSGDLHRNSRLLLELQVEINDLKKEITTLKKTNKNLLENATL